MLALLETLRAVDGIRHQLTRLAVPSHILVSYLPTARPPCFVACLKMLDSLVVAILISDVHDALLSKYLGLLDDVFVKLVLEWLKDKLHGLL